ncbi:DUF6714 family protein [Nodularia sp. UHCC 0506]|uniref:DUF6714 family protein n=1 Tax=Nodularia sp. UHCC 0506 TaxID=3110243 RepID=UPI002B1E9A5A|nr:DUF6714 family protein [Nodularia sp. UHCC 0506]MEA5514770.1 DUF6714 family protein [Nodularia sp. UHCC 0506]
MSKSSKRHIENLIREIEGAFSTSQYPRDDQLVYDNSGNHLECEEIARDFRGKDWKTIPLETLRYNADSLLFFTPQAYRFYLPAYLLASIQFYREADIITNNVVYSLTAPEEQGFEMKRFLLRVSFFSLTQKSAIRSFLKFLLTKHSGNFPLGDINTAIERFWRSENI